ncbi:hypothetical protein K439DRAFT_914315 [Ramaria rubella]|nr:hypothetical protein K439DRAFT_914315 [Ramaria rubella]
MRRTLISPLILYNGFRQRFVLPLKFAFPLHLRAFDKLKDGVFVFRVDIKKPVRAIIVFHGFNHLALLWLLHIGAMGAVSTV